MLSFFCPYRNRPIIFQDFIQDYATFYPDANIYMVEQNDDEPFKRGQSANIIFSELLKRGDPLENIVFVDIDLRLHDRIDFEGILEKNKAVTVPFDKIEVYDFIKVGYYMPSKIKSYFLTGDQIAGGLTLYTKDMFEACNGFSNVYVGWGCEDSDFLLRNGGVKHEKNTIIHLEHIRERRNHACFARNSKILSKRRTNPEFDGYRQTTIQEVKRAQLSEHVFHYKMKHIGVVKDFRYVDYF